MGLVRAADQCEGAAIEASGLSKHFFSGAGFGDLLRGKLRGVRVQALSDVELHVPRGQVLALMGENGAGKTTLLRIMAGLLIPDEGQLSVLGLPAARAGPELRRRVCYVVADERSFSWRLTGRQNLVFFAALYGLGRGTGRVDAALQAVGLIKSADRPVREYSSGMRQRLSVARGLLGEPELLLLDEPTRGLDPAGAVNLRCLLRRQVLGRGRTAVLATHDVTEAREICDRVVVLARGRVVADGPGHRAEELVLPAQCPREEGGP